MCHGLVHYMYTHNYVNVLMKLTPPPPSRPKIPMFFNHSQENQHFSTNTPAAAHGKLSLWA